MYAQSVLITGCNRGIGLELVKQLANKTEALFAGCRKPDAAKELLEIAESHKNISVLELDVTNEHSIQTAVKKVSNIVGKNGLNCLINNAGVANKGESQIHTITAKGLRDLYEVNAVAPAMMVKAFLPLLKQASSACDGDVMSVSRAAVLNVSSELSSIEKNIKAGVYGYRMSKIALNMLTMNLSIELKQHRILAVSLHPGWVKTDMGGKRARVKVFDSVEKLINVTSNFTETSNGLLYSWEGEILPW